MTETCFVCLDDDSSERLITGMCACRMIVHPSCMRDMLLKMNRTTCTVCKQEYRNVDAKYEHRRRPCTFSAGAFLVSATASVALMASMYILVYRVAQCHTSWLWQCVVNCLFLFVIFQMWLIAVLVALRLRPDYQMQGRVDRVMSDVVIGGV